MLRETRKTPIAVSATRSVLLSSFVAEQFSQSRYDPVGASDYREIGLRRIGSDKPPRASGGLLVLHTQRVVVLDQLFVNHRGQVVAVKR
jgi:hypothetical protein